MFAVFTITNGPLINICVAKYSVPFLIILLGYIPGIAVLKGTDFKGFYTALFIQSMDLTDKKKIFLKPFLAFEMSFFLKMKHSLFF